MTKPITIAEFNANGDTWRLSHLSTRPVMFKIGPFTVEQGKLEEQPGKISPWSLFRVFAGNTLIGRQISYPDLDDCTRMLESTTAEVKLSGNAEAYNEISNFPRITVSHSPARMRR